MTTVTVPSARNSLTVGLPTLLGVLIVLVCGAILTVTGTLNWHEYEHDAAILIGLLSIGHGIDSRSRP